MPGKKRIGIAILLLALCLPAAAQTLSWRGQASAWLGLNEEGLDATRLGIRYIPSFTLEKAFSGNRALDLVASGVITLANNAGGSGFSDSGSQGRLYRLWLRYALPQLEIRIGLQKITFGPAMLLRPLMWFDGIDPRDPLQLTRGVWGGLLRYYFLDNTNIWIWGLYGNSGLRGWDFLGSQPRKPEWGGRLQHPVPGGEMGLSLHHRSLETNGILKSTHPDQDVFREDRLGLDGRWDVGPGLWFEMVFIRQDPPLPDADWRTMLCLGADYTIGIGNGLTLTSEHLVWHLGEKILQKGEQRSFTALACAYPLGLLDTLSGIVFRDWTEKSWYRFINLERAYDRWSIYLMLFWNPSAMMIYSGPEGSNFMAGKGGQIMVVFNH